MNSSDILILNAVFLLFQRNWLVLKAISTQDSSCCHPFSPQSPAGSSDSMSLHRVPWRSASLSLIARDKEVFDHFSQRVTSHFPLSSLILVDATSIYFPNLPCSPPHTLRGFSPALFLAWITLTAFPFVSAFIWGLFWLLESRVSPSSRSISWWNMSTRTREGNLSGFQPCSVYVPRAHLRVEVRGGGH